ncbi:hypothetical protein BDY21DRAFT_367703 [Lineolata rhizophorae]|uniref:Uncharacterized protein n=1 Tax=Lineolata rhizophorae TaxID=578093 RepID=A0A6A6NLE4_9PEZI|nr:hypothetical protein BDY21DRAFT_367703 [Lineolata rhizophorae]
MTTTQDARMKLSFVTSNSDLPTHKREREESASSSPSPSPTRSSASASPGFDSEPGWLAGGNADRSSSSSSSSPSTATTTITTSYHSSATKRAPRPNWDLEEKFYVMVAHLSRGNFGDVARGWAGLFPPGQPRRRAADPGVSPTYHPRTARRSSCYAALTSKYYRLRKDYGLPQQRLREAGPDVARQELEAVTRRVIADGLSRDEVERVKEYVENM